MEFKYLVCVTEDNHNKFYTMKPKDDGSGFIVEYGRVGGTSTTVSYPERDFNKKLTEKLRKGYQDVTDLHRSTEAKSEYKDIPEEQIRVLVNRLMQMSRDAVRNNYDCSVSAVTDEMIAQAQSVIDDLSKDIGNHDIRRVEEFNRILTRSLFTIIPRKMREVSFYLAESPDNFDEIISREQSLLDNLKIQRQTIVPEIESPNQTVLEALGIEICMPDERDIATIKKLMGDSAYHFSRCWKVVNKETQKRFDQYLSNNQIGDRTKLLFHGSRNENWFSILKTGLKIRPSNAVATGSMFGNACYFSPTCKKSIGYTSLNGSYWARGNSDVAYMAVMEVGYGKPYDVYSFDSKYYNMNYNSLPRGTHCLHAHAGNGMLRNDEIVVYREDQCTIRYLVEIK